MRTKKSSDRFSRKLDKIFWFLIAIGPFIGYFLCVAFNGLNIASGSTVNLPNFFVTYVLGNVSFADNIVWNTLYAIFGPNSVFPIFANETALYIFNWFIWVELFHVFFDVIVFIPRIAHKWISKAVQDD